MPPQGYCGVEHESRVGAEQEWARAVTREVQEWWHPRGPKGDYVVGGDAQKGQRMGCEGQKGVIVAEVAEGRWGQRATLSTVVVMGASPRAEGRECYGCHPT